MAAQRLEIGIRMPDGSSLSREIEMVYDALVEGPREQVDSPFTIAKSRGDLGAPKRRQTLKVWLLYCGEFLAHSKCLRSPALSGVRGAEHSALVERERIELHGSFE